MRHGSGSTPAHAGDLRRRTRIELAGWAVALAVSVAVVAYVVNTSEWLMYTDGDSVIVAMMARSVLSGTPQDWAMSPVLFLPESVVYGVLSLLGLGVRGTLTLNAVVNLLALYGAIRLVAGRRRPGRTPVAGAVAAFAAFGVLVLLEGSAAAPGFQLATLLATTTYYSATVIAVVVTVGLVRRLVDGAAPLPIAATLAAVAVVSVLTNPLFAVWATAPVLVVLGGMALARRIPWATAMWAGGALAAGSAIGYLLRGLFGGTIVAAGDNYLRAAQWTRSADYFGGVLAQTALTWHGVVWLVAVAAVTVTSGVLAVRGWRRRDGASVFVGAVAVIAPVATTLGAIALGSDADRYLQPWVFLPVLALAVRPWRVPAVRRVGGIAVSAAVVVVLAVATPVAASAASRADADLARIVDWVNESGRTGAGQFWTVRAPKVHLDDPARLIQVDHTMRVYEWLVNRVDARDARVTFLVQDAALSPSFALPAGFDVSQARSIPCGRYTIYDFGDRAIPLGPPRN